MKDLYKIQILKWTCIGLLIRFILMPFTMHGQDLFFINYFPMMFIKAGIWDPYGFISANFSHFPYTYYGPVIFIIMSIANFIFVKIFNTATLVKILEISAPMMFKEFTTVDYIHTFSKLELFKNLFLMKSPYLIFDFLIGGILLKLAASKKSALASYKIWMLNIVVLHSAYAVGQLDLIPAFLIAMALFAAMKNRPYLCIISLSLGGATKLFPYVLIIPTCLLLTNTWQKRFLIFLTSVIATVLIYIPFYFSSGTAFLNIFIYGSFKQYPGMTKYILTGIFLVLYGLLCINAIKDSNKPKPEEKLLFYFLGVGFLTYAITPISFRYFVFITPLLVLLLPRNKIFGLFTLLLILMLAFLRLPERELQLGLFAPINPEYFMNFPTIQEVLGNFMNIEIIYGIMARILIIAFFIAAWWVWRIKLINEGPFNE